MDDAEKNGNVLRLTDDELEQDIVAQAEADKAEALANAKAVFRAAVNRLAEDKGAVFEDDVVAALAVVQQASEAEYQRAIASAKSAGASITPLKKLVKLALKAAEDSDACDEGDRGMTELLVNIASSACELFHDDSGECFVTFTVGGHRETWSTDSKGFREWLEYEAYKRTSRVPKKANMDDARGTIAGKARHEGKCIEVARRVGVDSEGMYLIDLCDEQWRVVKVWPGGWRIEPNPPVRFIRSQNARPLPMPVAGGDVRKLWLTANVSPDDRHVLLAVIIDCYICDTPYVVTEFTGLQGTAKSTSQNAVRNVVDPNLINLRGRPKTAEDIYVAAGANHLISYENLSHLSDDQQDALCVVATGGGDAKRRLYTNHDESAITVKRPVMLNGIDAVATRPDLIDRRVSVELQPVTKRKLKRQVEAEFDANKAEIFGGLLDLFAGTLQTLQGMADEVEKLHLPRMADFGLLGEAVYRTLGHNPGCFLAVYADRKRMDVLRTLDSSPTISALVAEMRNGAEFIDELPSELLARLKEAHPSISSDAPKSGRGMGALLSRYMPSLAAIGITVVKGIVTNRGLAVRITGTPNASQTQPEREACPACLEQRTGKRTFLL